MPFLFRLNGVVHALFSESIPRTRQRARQIVRARPTAWKLQWHATDKTAPAPLPMGLAQDEEECSPTLCQTDSGVQLSFIGAVHHRPVPGGTPAAGHRLFVTSGPDLDHLPPPRAYNDNACFCGFARPDLAIQGSGRDGTARIFGRPQKVLETSFVELARISYRFDAPSQILITGLPQRRHAPQTVIFDLDTAQVLGELQVDGRSCYKPTMLTDLAVTPVIDRGGSGWQLVASAPAIVPTSITVNIR